ncbi:3-hydroxyacyl-CoA dehydrogenase NAD-binding domain-containing protein [Mesorhizobium sp. C374B]|nr:3-hydroxyacyl-CoA dehydrogenase NAD-binding domain-containing protein [Mesorhizobium sp. C374B]
MRAGLDIVVYDKAADGETFLKETLNQAMPALIEIGMAEGASPSRVHFTNDLETALENTNFVQESAPENIDLKTDLIAEIDARTAPDVVIASSSSGFLASDLRSRAKHSPQRVLIGHPFNPPYLIPLVEIAGGDGARKAALDATAFYRLIGCEVVELDREIPGYIANRIQYAVLREILYLMAEGVASLEAIDRAIAAGPGIRWAVMGASSVFYLGRRESTFREGMEILGRDMEAGRYMAPSSFQPDQDLMRAYADQITSKIGANGQSGLIALRNSGVAGIRSVLKRVRDTLESHNA